jgi:alpha-beta hydrolase superfamily lysophospholipase
MMRIRLAMASGVLLAGAGAPQPRLHAQPQVAASSGVTVRTSVVDGLTLQYLAAGHGPAVVLLHGYTETSRMWKPLMPRLAESFTVIAPDLPGIGGSAIPEDGVDMTRAGR